MSDLLLKIKHLAAKAHAGQLRKFEKAPYIVHLVRVMKTCREYTASKTVLAAALLHDVFEDTAMKADELIQGLQRVMSPASAALTVHLVEELTDQYTKARFPQWNRRERKQREADRLAACSADAQTIKYADLIDNAATLSSADPDFAARYCQEALHLLQKLDKGHAELRSRAMQEVYFHQQQLTA